MKRLIPAALLLAACATTQTTTAPGKTEPTKERLKVGNALLFDLASCGPRALELTPLTAEGLTGALLSLGPAFEECFIDAKNAEGEFKASIKATVGAQVTFEVNGTGASAAGKACVLAAAQKLGLKPLDAAAKPLTAEVPLRSAGKAVVFGENVASDVAGTIRLATPSMCECFTELNTKVPPVLVAKLTLYADTKDKDGKDVKAQDPEVAMDPNEVPTTSDCLTAKLKAMPFPKKAVQFPYSFLLKNSYATDLAANGSPAALHFQSLDGAREQRTADVMIATGKRGEVAGQYDDIVKKYKAKPDFKLVPELKTKCAAVVTADESWIAASKNLKANYEASLALVTAEKAKDASSWSALEQKLTAQVGDVDKLIAAAEGQKKNDQGACPKSSGK